MSCVLSSVRQGVFGLKHYICKPWLLDDSRCWTLPLLVMPGHNHDHIYQALTAEESASSNGLGRDHSHDHDQGHGHSHSHDHGHGHRHAHDGHGHGKHGRSAAPPDDQGQVSHMQSPRVSLHKSSSREFQDEPSSLDRAQLRLLYAMVLCSLFMVAELVGGFLARSLAIMTDAVHLLSDVAGMGISVLAIGLARRQATSVYSYGYHRAELLGAFFNVQLIWVLTGALCVDAAARLVSPVPVNGKIMVIVSSVGMVANALMMCVLGEHGHSHFGSAGHGHSHGEHGHGEHGHSEHRHVERAEHEHGHGNGHSHGHEHGHQHGHDHREGHGHSPRNHEDTKGSSIRFNLNLRAAYVHVIGDLIQNLGVLLAAGLIWWQPFDIGYFENDSCPEPGCSNWALADPICTIIFAVAVFYTTVNIAKDTINVLMIRSPPEVDLDGLKRKLGELPGVIDVHDLHVWPVSVGKIAATMHICINFSDEKDTTLSEAISVCGKFEIQHATIQIEHVGGYSHGPIRCSFSTPLSGGHGHSHRGE